MMYIICSYGMRYPADHKQQTRERIVRAASRRFRSRGTDGAAIAELMRDLRLTHGGFYRHFGSKEGLVAEAFEAALREWSDRAVAAIGKAPPGAEMQALIDSSLDPGHCEDLAGGCPVAALASRWHAGRKERAARFCRHCVPTSDG